MCQAFRGDMGRKWHFYVIVVCLIIFYIAAGPLDARTEPGSLNDTEINARIEYIQAAFDDVQTYSKWWSYGWIGIE